MDPEILVLGLALGFLFCLVMVFKVLPPLDHIVKKNKGPVEACLFTRFCPLVIALPFYVFTIWMTVVIVMKEDKAISVIDQICPEDFDCYNSFSLGRARFNKNVCLSVDSCPEDELQARSGQKPLHFPRLGLGEALSPSEFTVDFTCVDTLNDDCIAVESSEGPCECVDNVTNSDAIFSCASDTCFDDVSGNSKKSTCLDDECNTWLVETDSDKQFSFQNCSCTSEDCLTFQCDVFLMPYFYPNIFYAGCVTILFILPVFVGLYVVIKAHMKKIFPCGKVKMYVYNQEAGMQEEDVAENLATGGFNNQQSEKTRARKFGLRDVLAIGFGLLVLVFFSWQVMLVSGRIGLAFITLVPATVALVEIYKLFKHLESLRESEAERVEKHNPDPLYGEF